MGFEIDGLDDLQNDLERLQNRMQKFDDLDGERVPFDRLFSDKFTKKYTDADNIEGFFANSPWKIKSQGEFEDIPETELDEYVDNHSQFRTWGQMKGKAKKNL
jgi:hypothetical protein